MKKIIPFTKDIEFKTMISKVTSISLEHTLRANENNLIDGYFIIEGTYKMTQASQIDEDFSYKIPVEIEIDDRYDMSNVRIDIDDFTYEVVDEERMHLDISLCIDNLEEKVVELEEIKIEDIEVDEEKVEEVENIISDEGADEVRNNGILDDLFLDTSQMEDLEIHTDNVQESEKTILERPVNQEDLKSHNQCDNTNKPQYNEMENVSNTTIGVDSLFSSFKDNAETFKTYSVYIVKDEDTIDSIMIKYNVSKEDLEEYNNLSDIKIGSKVVIPNSKNE